MNDSVEQRARAYENNPDALQQRYAQNQQLIDLLALQKLKSEKEAAARDIQLKMGQRGKPPTIAAQREKEVGDMTRQEVAQQTAGAMQQKQQEQQQALQQVAGAAQGAPAGLPSIPQPGMMTPKAMAAGGIVAFEKGGNEGLEDARKAAAAEEKRKRNSLLDRLFPAVVQVESGGTQNPATAVSPKGARGSAQVMPGTLKDPGFGVRPAQDTSDEENKRVGRDYLDAMLRRYKDVDTALMAYNWGPGSVDKWIKGGRDADSIPLETRNYLPKVRGALAQREKGAGEKVAEGITSLIPSAQAGELPSKQQMPLQTEELPSKQQMPLQAGEPRPSRGPSSIPVPPRSYSDAIASEQNKFEGNEITDWARGLFDLNVGRTPPVTSTYPEETSRGRAADAPPKPYPIGTQNNDNRPSKPYPLGVRSVDNDARPSMETPPPAVPVLSAPPPVQMAAPNDFDTRIQSGILNLMGTNPQDMAAKEQALAQTAYGRSPEEIALAKRNREAVAAANRARFDPERMRNDELQRTLLGMVGGTTNLASLAMGSRAGLDYRTQMGAEQRQRMLEEQKAEEGDFAVDRDIRGKAFGAREKQLQEGSAMLRQGIASGTTMSDSINRIKNDLANSNATREAQVKINNADNLVKMLTTQMTVDAQKELNSITNESNRLYKLEQLRNSEKRTALTPLQREKLAITERQLPNTPMSPADRAALEAVEKLIDAYNIEIDNKYNDLLKGGGGDSTKGWSKPTVVQK